VTLVRGVDTSVGQAGYCEACGVSMPDGPDACLGYLPNVSHACCGHGGVTEAYVVIGGEPDETCVDRNCLTLRGVDALVYFDNVRALATPPSAARPSRIRERADSDAIRDRLASAHEWFS
jgi:hypothetical protein